LYQLAASDASMWWAMELPVLFFSSAAEWRAWLEEHHADAAGAWIRYAKKGSGTVSVRYAEAVEEALCFGWIDGQAARDPDDPERYSRQRYTPRKARSKWSKINVGRAEKLISEGRMAPAGLAEVERARSDGRWAAAYDSPSTATVPDDLQAALDASPAAAAFFSSLKGNNRYAILYRIQTVKREETRARKIAEFVAMLERGETLH
jgi:uncharacterized protein YdeI (YjbR/CyaY-like superfamily)